MAEIRVGKKIQDFSGDAVKYVECFNCSLMLHPILCRAEQATSSKSSGSEVRNRIVWTHDWKRDCF